MPIALEYAGDAACIIIDRPPVNALDLATVLEMESMLERLDRSRSLIVTGSGSSFSAGVDTRSFARASLADRQEQVRAITRVSASLLSFEAPVIAAVNGHAMGGGFVLMLCADYRIATRNDSACYGLTEAAAGVPFPAGPLEIICQEIPMAMLRRLTLTSAVIGLETLLEAGIVDESCETEQLMQIAAERAGELCRQPAFAVVKRQVRGRLQRALAGLAASGRDPHLDDFATP